MTGDPDLVGTDWVKSDLWPKVTRPLGWGHFFVTGRRPNCLIKWAETSHGGGVGPWDRHALRVGVSVKTDKNSVFSQKGAEFGHDP